MHKDKFLPEGNFPPEVITVFLSPLFMEFSSLVHLSAADMTSNFLQVSNLQAGDRFEKQTLSVLWYDPLASVLLSWTWIKAERWGRTRGIFSVKAVNQQKKKKTNQ